MPPRSVLARLSEHSGWPKFHMIPRHMHARPPTERNRIERGAWNLKPSYAVNDDCLFIGLGMTHFGARASITDGDRAIHSLSDVYIVRHDDRGQPEFRIQSPQEIEDLGRGDRIELASWLIRQ